MEDNSKKINLGDPDKLPEADRTSDSYIRENPGLKEKMLPADVTIAQTRTFSMKTPPWRNSALLKIQVRIG